MLDDQHPEQEDQQAIGETLAIRPTKVLGYRQTFALTIGGYLFLLIAAAALGGLFWFMVFRSGSVDPYRPSPGVSEGSDTFKVEMTNYYLAKFDVPIAMLFAATIASTLGYLLIRSAGTAIKQVIPTEDYELLSRLLLASPDAGIDNYIRLSSLTGMTGMFTKVGLSGLPLATISLTVVFSILSIWSPDFFDLAKLTLGAFLGSYVQRNVSAANQAGPEAQSTVGR